MTLRTKEVFLIIRVYGIFTLLNLADDKCLLPCTKVYMEICNIEISYHLIRASLKLIVILPLSWQETGVAAASVILKAQQPLCVENEI